ncbi:phytanoyl-CoA dioxygenase family protein [Streptomyces sp. NPDC006967]|uniref:phytanoyl-CoA dioxygenase family protein n=1 Tax=Streptomyces sp. NPDC006967 TaxID=3156906 RepID=UPI0033DDCE4B
MSTELAAQLRTFGFVHLRNCAASLIEQLEGEFEGLIGVEEGERPEERVTVRGVMDDMPALARLAALPLVTSLCDGFFGTAHHVITSDLNLLVGDSYWHSDGFYGTPFLRFVGYMEPLNGDNGALRFLPGSQTTDSGWQGEATRDVMKHETQLGVSGADLPAAVVETEPGDVVVFDTNVLHSAWNGTCRRQFAFNVVGAPNGPQALHDTTRYFLNRYTQGTVLLT